MARVGGVKFADGEDIYLGLDLSSGEIKVETGATRRFKNRLRTFGSSAGSRLALRIAAARSRGLIAIVGRAVDFSVWNGLGSDQVRECDRGDQGDLSVLSRDRKDRAPH